MTKILVTIYALIGLIILGIIIILLFLLRNSNNNTQSPTETPTPTTSPSPTDQNPLISNYCDSGCNEPKNDSPQFYMCPHLMLGRDNRRWISRFYIKHDGLLQTKLFCK